MQSGMVVHTPSCKQYKSYVLYRRQTPAGWAQLGKPAGLLLGPEPVIATPPRVAGPGERLEVEVTAPWSGTWINQDQLIAGQQPWNTFLWSYPKIPNVYRSGAKRMVGNLCAGNPLGTSIETSVSGRTPLRCEDGKVWNRAH